MVIENFILIQVVFKVLGWGWEDGMRGGLFCFIGESCYEKFFLQNLLCIIFDISRVDLFLS